MNKHRKRPGAARDRPAGGEKRSMVYLGNWDSERDLACAGYTTLAQSPEVSTAVDRIAALAGSMTIHLMRNGPDGDLRVKNELSRVVDVTPNAYMVRSAFVRWIVRTLYHEGNGNAVVFPITEDGYLRELRPIPAYYVSFYPTGLWDYRIAINGRPYDPDELLHFVLNPGTIYPWLGDGYRVTLRDVAHNLKQALATEKGFMESKWKPSIIVKVDGLIDEMSYGEGRKRLLDSYVTETEAGQPWLIPAEQFDVQTVKPLTLSDLALADFVELDKRTVATILGVPPFVLGVGDFKRDEWNNFISTTLMPLAHLIEQELTRKLLYSPEYFFRFNSRSLYNYDLKDMAQIADDQYVRGLMTGNEVRDWLGLSPLDGLNDLVILENYIPRAAIGDQAKLVQEGESK